MSRTTTSSSAASTIDVMFRALRREQFDLLRRWLTDPLVARWWNHETSSTALERDFGAAVDGRDPTAIFIADVGGRPFGLLQRYAVSSYPAYQAELAAVCHLPEGAMSIDYLIGEPALRGRGLGAAMIAAGAARLWQEQPDCADVIVPVHAANRASWRALERAGFERIAEGRLEPDNPHDSHDHYVYRAQRPAE
jgi:aminoglycoside 6'-N-acetyltransferase